MKNNTDNTGISAEKLAELKDQAREILAQVRHKALAMHPFTGTVSMRLDLVPTRDYRNRTACTDGHSIYFDIDFLSKLSKDEQLFVLSHEIWHVIMMHMIRKQNRIIDLFNIATDCEVNYMLRCDGLIPPDGLCFPEHEWEGKSAEEIYEILLKQQKKQIKNGSGLQSSEKSKSSGNSGNSESGNSGSGGGKNSNSKSKSGNNTNGLEGQFDRHEYEDSEDGQSNNGVTDQWGEVGEDPDYQPHITKHLADEIRECVISAAQQVERTKGSIPEHIKGILDKMVKPEIRWQEVLAKFVSATFSSGERTWLPPNRRYVWQDIYLPSVYDEKVNVTVAIDTSGSTTGDLPKFFSELMSLMNSFGSYKVNVIQCDCAVDSFETYDSDENPFDFDIKNFKITGGGGSSTVPVFDKIKDDGIETNALIYLTDGYIDCPQFPPAYPVLWVICKDGNENFCPWGTKIKLNNAT